MSLLEIKNVDISYGKNLTVKNVSLSLEKGEICSIVGESGSGKTTVIRAVLGLLPGAGRVSAGSITYDGKDLLNLTDSEWRNLRGYDMSMIFQDSGAMMNALRLIGDSYVEYIRTHEEISKEDAWAKGVEMLERMRLPDGDRIMHSYPFQLSGGQRQRVGIAMGMTYRPKLLLADEPTSALDVTTQAQIVRQFMELRDEYGTSIIIVTHNLGVAAYMGDKIVVMKHGEVVDRGERDYILHQSTNPYTKLLLDAVPTLGGKRYV
ncbi:MAG: ABC transporter ATP-binding protein [Schwartzia sp.]|nr:ABC transporter ATP-binding protein [Schwartzia sp. (in: firmicutes)]